MSTVIKGLTLKGSAIGRTFGFPTINISYDGNDSGVFAGRLYLDGNWQLAAINIGGRPTIDNVTNLCEAFLLDWDGVVEEGTEVEIKLLKKIREVKKFNSIDELKEQISKDVEFIKSCYTGKEK